MTVVKFIDPPHNMMKDKGDKYLNHVDPLFLWGRECPPPLFLVLPSPPYATQSASFFRLILDELIPSECDQSSQIGRGSWRGTLTASFLHCIGYTQSGEEKQWRDDARRGSTSDARPGKFAMFVLWPLFQFPFFLRGRRAEKQSLRPLWSPYPPNKSGLFVNQVSAVSALSSLGPRLSLSSADYDSVEWTSVGRSVG